VKWKWTEEHDAQLRAMARDYSASHIAGILGTSRNAVIGRCYRKGIDLGGPEKPDRSHLVSRPVAKPAHLLPLSAPERKKRAHAYPDAEPAELAAVCISVHEKREAAMVAPTGDWQPARISLMDLRENTCRWPLWVGSGPFAEKFYCGNESLPGQAYCRRCHDRSVPAASVAASLDRRIEKARAAA
jgi:GcrA cell cycle regulator